MFAEQRPCPGLRENGFVVDQHKLILIGSKTLQLFRSDGAVALVGNKVSGIEKITVMRDQQPSAGKHTDVVVPVTPGMVQCAIFFACVVFYAVVLHKSNIKINRLLSGYLCKGKVAAKHTKQEREKDPFHMKKKDHSMTAVIRVKIKESNITKAYRCPAATRVWPTGCSCRGLHQR